MRDVKVLKLQGVLMITLFGSPASVFVRKPRILLEEKKVKFIIDPINLYQYISDEFKRASPLNKIPAFQDGSFTLADSSAICAYIDRKYPIPKFYPDSPEEYGKVLWFEEYADTVLFQTIAPCYYQTVLVPLYHDREPDQSAIDHALNYKLPPVAGYLESQLINREFFVGEKFTIADVAVVSMFLNMYLSGFSLDPSFWPNLCRYLGHHFKRESFFSCRADVESELLMIGKIRYENKSDEQGKNL